MPLLEDRVIAIAAGADTVLLINCVALRAVGIGVARFTLILMLRTCKVERAVVGDGTGSCTTTATVAVGEASATCVAGWTPASPSEKKVQLSIVTARDAPTTAAFARLSLRARCLARTTFFCMAEVGFCSPNLFAISFPLILVDVLSCFVYFVCFVCNVGS